MTAKQDIP